MISEKQMIAFLESQALENILSNACAQSGSARANSPGPHPAGVGMCLWRLQNLSAKPVPVF